MKRAKYNERVRRHNAKVMNGLLEEADKQYLADGVAWGYETLKPTKEEKKK